tara:strand:+ start:750 stop:959 length:210 start_codon:yes stop_codon:yes gene_type:complete
LLKDEIILKAAIELDPEWNYDFRNGTLGPTLYIHTDSKEKAHIIRKIAPGTFEGYYVIVTYSYSVDIGD